MEDAYIVRGGHPLKGEVQLSGAKNASLKIIIASLLFDGPVAVANIPHIGDIEDLLRLINILGGEARFIGRNEVVIDGGGIRQDTIDLLHASKTRVSFMLFAPLLYRLGQASIPNPGGCRIGSRPIDRQIAFMKAMGIKVAYDEEDGYYKAKLANRIKGAAFQFDQVTHTGTEFAIMLACLACGESTIGNICQEPEVDDLIDFLNAGGAKISKKNDVLSIQGVDRLIAKEKYRVSSDRNEAVTLALFALATKGEVYIKSIEPPAIQTFIDTVKKTGAGVAINQDKIHFFYDKALQATDVVTSPHPGFMTDWQAPWAVLMTQADGVSTIHETVFENRFGYVEELAKLGAHIDYFEPSVTDPEKLYQFHWSDRQGDPPQAIKIFGKTNLHNGVLYVSDLRAGASLLIAASVASGESVVRGASVIDRGYEAIDKKLRGLGGIIKKV